MGLLVGLGLLHCSSEESARPDQPLRDVLLVTVDTLRADHLGIYGYSRPTSPRLDAFFADAARYRRSYAAESSTPPSVISFLSGRLPQDHGIRMYYQLLDPAVPILPDLLPDHYQSAAIVSNIVLTDEALGIAGRFDYYDDYVDQREGYRKVFERNAEATTEAAIRFLQHEQHPERPLFLWVHYIDPHGPYNPPASFERRFESSPPVMVDLERILPYVREPGNANGADYVDRYDEEILYTDGQVQRLLDAFAEVRELDDTLVIFSSDHGESLMDHEGWFRHGHHVYEEVVVVPLMVKGPGVVPGWRDELVSGIDIASTILAHAGVPIAGDLSNVDLRTGTGLSADRTVFTEGGFGTQWRAAIQRERKWMTQLQGRSNLLGQRRLYDLEKDPLETRPLPWSPDHSPARALTELIRTDPDPGRRPSDPRRGEQITEPKISPRATAEDIERLRALGYVED